MSSQVDSNSFLGRAVLAVALTVAFYALALAIALGLIAAPIALWQSTGSGNIWVTIALIGTGLAILRAILPERNRYSPPGPELTREEQPRLHALLDDVAERVGEPPADAVYLDLELNAAVLEHRRRRVMELGLPLLAILEADELRAVVAHEYGHYVGGDTRFSRWIWRTRVAVIKTVHRLASDESWFRRYVVRWPFQGYALLFLRITNAVSRRAEFAADALAARVSSPEAAGSALRRTEALAPAFDAYWDADVAPLLGAQRRPAIALGFARVAAGSTLGAALDSVARTDLEPNEPNPYSSHPTLRQRLEALGVPAESGAPPAAKHPALELLDGGAELEGRLLEAKFGPEAGALKSIDWAGAAEIHLDGIREMAARFRGALPAELTIEDAGRVAAEPEPLLPGLRELLPPDDQDAPDEVLSSFLIEVLGSFVVARATQAGAEVTTAPGEPLSLRLDGESLDVWTELAKISRGEVDAAGWAEHPVVRALSEAPSPAG